MEFVLLALAVATVAVIIASQKKDKKSPTKTEYISVNPKDLDQEELKKRPKL